ncbi:MAG: hypothetical protein Q7J80_11790 [Anaerolineales bacterium]|nr:hypothetical protein [Anaerolineales bacterium]
MPEKIKSRRLKMNRKYRLSIAVLLAVVLVLTAVGAWAAPVFQGTVPPPPQGGEGDSDTPIVLGGVKVTTECDSCSFTATIAARVNLPPPPTGKEFIGNAISVNIHGSGLVNLTFPSGPNKAGQGIWRLDYSTSPAEWVAVPDAYYSGGQWHVDGVPGGIYVLMGND